MNKIITSFTLSGIISLSPAFALADFDNAVYVTNENSAYVRNEVTVKADSGDNSANGGYASGPAGSGGSVNGSGDGNTGGNGGSGGDGGDGGTVLTGAATAVSLIENEVNTNKTKVNLCDCDGHTKVKVRNYNHAKVKNEVYVKADSGDNMADGGSASGSAGAGGAVNTSGDGNKGGTGGGAGDGGAGGLVDTLDATAGSEIVIASTGTSHAFVNCECGIVCSGQAKQGGRESPRPPASGKRHR